jgi:exopolysaccharide biosynthesis protein
MGQWKQKSLGGWGGWVVALAGLVLLVGGAGRGGNEPVRLERVVQAQLPLRAVVARVDLSTGGVEVVSLPAGGLTGEAVWGTTLETVSAVAEREHLMVAINGDFFRAERTVDAEGVAARNQYVRGKRAMPTGNAVSGGKVWAKSAQPLPMLVVSREGRVSIVRQKEVPAGAREVVSGNRMLVEQGKAMLEHKESDLRAPRTAVGLSEDGNELILVVVDGRSILSRGCTLGEMADFMAGLGAFTALNLDGGGSSAMVSGGGDGKVELLNSPSDGQERPVANVLGVRKKK